MILYLRVIHAVTKITRLQASLLNVKKTGPIQLVSVQLNC